MTNVNIVFSGYIEKILEYMLKGGYAKTKTEALRLALFEFDQRHKIVPKEDTAYELVAQNILLNVNSGKEKVKKFSFKELD